VGFLVFAVLGCDVLFDVGGRAVGSKRFQPVTPEISGNSGVAMASRDDATAVGAGTCERAAMNAASLGRSDCNSPSDGAAFPLLA